MDTDRRTKDRLKYVLPLTVQGNGKGGKAYRFEALARDISAGGLCAYAPRAVRPGDRLSMRVRFAHPASRLVQAPEFALRGRVVRVEKRPTGLCRFAVSFLLRPGSRE